MLKLNWKSFCLHFLFFKPLADVLAAPEHLQISQSSNYLDLLKDNPNFPFQSQSEKLLVQFFDENNLSASAVDEFLDKVHRKQIIMPDVTISSRADIDKLFNQVPHVPWIDCDLRNFFDATLYTGDLGMSYQPAWEIYKESFANPQFADSMNLYFRRCSKDGQRAYGPMNTAVWWEYVEGLLPAGSVVFAYLIASDATLVFSKGSKKFHPIYLINGNVDARLRKKDNAIYMIGHVPILDRKDFLGNDTQWLEFTHSVWNAAYEKCFDAMKAHEYTGAWIQDGNGAVHFGFPRFSYGIYDWQELKKATGSLFCNLSQYHSNTFNCRYFRRPYNIYALRSLFSSENSLHHHPNALFFKNRTTHGLDKETGC
eukprot:Pompholyxophrys_punicea_v1_NODE_27_length_5184_cov_24.170599.p1 type:complete len:369 gc:universal NODE_27_length_5184_cov_24.170599:1303-197(-)